MMLTSLQDKLKDFFASSALSFELNTQPDRIEKWQYIILGLFLFFACFYGMSSYAILDMNEGLYAEIAREMLVNKHFIIPYLNNVPYLEKPPLLYWLIALSYHVFGINAFAARLIPSIFFALSSLMVFYAGMRLKASRTGFIAAIILLSSLIFAMIGRVVFFDMMLTFFVGASLFSFYFWTESKKNSDLYLTYIFLALAVLTKGFLSLVLVPLVITVFLLLTRASREDYLELLNKKAIIIFLAITLPWHILAVLVMPQFFWEYFINNQLLRFFNLRIPHDYHNGPVYYYIPRAIAYLLPWTLFLPALFLRKRLDKLKLFLISWFGVMFLFFTLSGDKGDYYLVIGIIPIAYLLAQKIEDWFVEAQSKYLCAGFYFISLGLIILGLIALIFYRSPRADYADHFSGNKIPFILTDSIIFLVIILIIYGIAGFCLCKKNPNKPMVPFLFTAGLIVPLMFFYLNVREDTQFMYSQISLAKYVQAQYQTRTVYFYQDFESLSSFVFYNHDPSIMIDSKSADLYFGAHTKESKGKFISVKDFLVISQKAPVYIVMKNNKLAEFQKAAGEEHKAEFCIVQRNGNVILLSNTNEDCRADVNIQGQQKPFNLTALKKNS